MSDGLLTVDDLAARWQVTPERAWKRVRDADLPCVNLGTLKNPEHRFRVETVAAWEESAERPLSSLGGEAAPAESAKPPLRFIRPDRSGRQRPTVNDPLAGL